MLLFGKMTVQNMFYRKNKGETDYGEQNDRKIPCGGDGSGDVLYSGLFIIKKYGGQRGSHADGSGDGARC